MRLEQFEYLIAVKNHNSMHAAARELFVSQQSISKAMKELEEELHTKIFKRSSKGTQLTEEGQAIYLHAVNIMKEVEALKESYAEKNKKPLTFSNILRLYVANSVFNFASDSISRFSMTYDSRINIVEIDTRDILNLFEKSNTEELALVQIPVDELKKREDIVKYYDCYVLANERLKIAMNKQSRYAQYSSISLKTLSQIPLMINTTSMDNLPIHVKVLTDMGVKLNIQFITNSRSSNRYLRDNVACALCTDSNYETVDDKAFTCLVPIKEKIYVAMCLLVKKEHLSDVSRAFVEKTLQDSDAEKIF